MFSYGNNSNTEFQEYILSKLSSGVLYNFVRRIVKLEDVMVLFFLFDYPKLPLEAVTVSCKLLIA